MANGRYDAIVVGSGPAGSTAAYRLARAGLRTLLLEKQKLPRYKTCGGGVTFKAARALPFPIDSVVERTLYDVDFSWRTRHPYVRHSKEPLVLMVQRSRFDNLLAEQAAHAGADLLDGTPMLSLDSGPNGVSVQTPKGRFEASYLIGADGATGRVAHSLGLMAGRYALAALESEVEVEPWAMDHWRDRIGLDLGVLRASYGWVFPKGDHLSVGVGGLPMLDDYGKRLKGYDEMHTRARVPGRAIKRVVRSHGYLLPCKRPGEPVVKGRAALVGDAAGLVEAFTGEGIYWAIRSAQLAARAIVAGDLSLYTRTLGRALMPDLLSARRWMRVFVNAPYACYFLPKALPPFWHAVCNIIRGESRYRDIRHMLGPAGVIERLLPDPLPASKG